MQPNPSPIQASRSGGLLTVGEAAAYLKMSKSWIDKARVLGGGPRFCRIGRLIRYRMETLDAYAEASERSNTSEAA